VPLPTRAVPTPHAMHSLKTLYAVYPFTILASAVTQIIALRWALNRRWSDFRLQVVAEDQSTPAT